MSKGFKAINMVYLLISAALLIVILSSCSSNSTNTISSNVSTAQKSATFSKITPEEAKKRLDNEKGIILLDVRTKEEYESGHIKGSKLIPVDVINEEAEKNITDKEAPIFVYCRSGNRSATAANILVKLGYKNVYDLGGINNWPFEVVKQ